MATHVIRRGIAVIPMSIEKRRNPIASPIVPIRLSASMEPCSTTLVTTVRITNPKTSSTTAAPRTIRASVDDRARRSPKTRAVIPTLVAARAEPKKRDAFIVSPRTVPAKMPDDIGIATPIIATRIETRPTFRNSPRSISSPTSARRTMTPISARIFRASLGSTSPNMDGPMAIPMMISPRTAGT